MTTKHEPTLRRLVAETLEAVADSQAGNLPHIKDDVKHKHEIARLREANTTLQTRIRNLETGMAGDYNELDRVMRERVNELEAMIDQIPDVIAQGPDGEIRGATINRVMRHLGRKVWSFEHGKDLPTADLCGAVFVYPSGERADDTPCIKTPGHDGRHIDSAGEDWY